MIFQIGRTTLTESCRQMAAWQRRFGAAAPACVCVNVSSRQFADAELAAQIEAILKQTGLCPSRLKLEITESAFLGDCRARRSRCGGCSPWASSGASTTSGPATRR